MKTLWKEKWIFLFIFVTSSFNVCFSAVVLGEKNKNGRQLDAKDEHLANETDSEEVLDELKKEPKPEAMADAGDGPTTASGFNEFASSDQSTEVPSKETDNSQDSNDLNKLGSGDTEDKSISNKASSSSAEKVENNTDKENTGPDNNITSENSDSKEPSNVDQFVSKDSTDVNKLGSGDSGDSLLLNKVSSSSDEKVENNTDEENTGLDNSYSQSSHEKNTGKENTRPDNNLTSESSDFDIVTKDISSDSGDTSKIPSSRDENVENNTDEENTGLGNSDSQSSHEKNNTPNSNDSGTDIESSKNTDLNSSGTNFELSDTTIEHSTTEWETEETFKISDKLKIWPKATIPFYIDDVSFAPAFRNKIREYLDSINRMTGVNFVEMSIPPQTWSHRFIFFLNRREVLQCQDYTSGSFSRSGPQAVTLGYNSFDSPGCMNSLVLAILGVTPQHNAPDRDNYITVNYKNILPEYKKFYRKVESSEWPFNSMEYDFESAGHYGSFKFTRNGGATIQFNKETPKQSGMLTRSDLEKISFLYQTAKTDVVKGVPPICKDLFNIAAPKH